jgi:hypothetical protein
VHLFDVADRLVLLRQLRDADVHGEEKVQWQARTILGPAPAVPLDAHLSLQVLLANGLALSSGASG